MQHHTLVSPRGNDAMEEVLAEVGGGIHEGGEETLADSEVS